MEATALKHVGADGLRGPTPLLRLQSDDRLVTLTRRGNQAAYEALVGRYQSRLLAFCRHMLGSREDAEDVLQDVFAAAFHAMLADERPLNVRPWLYRIARNRSLNHLRRATAIGVDSMDVHLSDGGATTADKVHRREEFRLLMQDVQQLPETQRTALLLREIDALSYEQISEAMETTVPSIKSLLVRARVSLAEAAEARQLTCAEVREELGEVAEGLKRTTAPVRRHVRQCDRCAAFRKQLKKTNRALASIFPVGPLLVLKKLVLANLGTTASAGSGAAAGAAASGAAAGAGAATAGSALSAGMGAIASKAVAGLAAAAIVTAGAVEVDHARQRRAPAPAAAAVAPAQPVLTAPHVVASEPQPAASLPDALAGRRDADGHRSATAAKVPLQQQPASATQASLIAAPAPVPQQRSDTTTLPSQPGTTDGATGGVVAPPPNTTTTPQPQTQTAPAPAPATVPAPTTSPAPADQTTQPQPGTSTDPQTTTTDPQTTTTDPQTTTPDPQQTTTDPQTTTDGSQTTTTDPQTTTNGSQTTTPARTYPSAVGP